MKLYRIWAIVIRHLYHFRHSYDRLSDAVYWPVMDLVLWGLTTKWVQQENVQVSNIALIILTGIVFWQIIWRSNYEISVNLLEEFWNDNLANLFSTPLKLGEWIIAVMIIGFLKNFITVIVGVGAVYLLYSLNILTIGWYLLPFFFLLLISGWFMGFIASAFIIYFGRPVQTLAWTMGFLLAPFSAVYYPVDMLPPTVRFFSNLLPTTYIFEGMREVIKSGHLGVNYLVMSTILNIIYLLIAISFFSFMFEKRRKKGLLTRG